jgi:hypothetical protein
MGDHAGVPAQTEPERVMGAMVSMTGFDEGLSVPALVQACDSSGVVVRAVLKACGEWLERDGDIEMGGRSWVRLRLSPEGAEILSECPELAGVLLVEDALARAWTSRGRSSALRQAQAFLRETARPDASDPCSQAHLRVVEGLTESLLALHEALS